MNQDILLKFSALVYHDFVQIWQKNFCHCLINLPATAHFGHTFGCLQRPYLLRYFKKKKKVRFLTCWSNLLKGLSISLKKWRFEIFQTSGRSTFTMSTDKGIPASLGSNRPSLKMTFYKINSLLLNINPTALSITSFSSFVSYSIFFFSFFFCIIFYFI